MPAILDIIGALLVTIGLLLTFEAFNEICAALEAVGKQLYTEGKDFVGVDEEKPI